MRDERDGVFISIVEIFLQSILERERFELLNIRGVTFWLLTRDNKIHARYLRREQSGRSSGKVFNHACLLSFIADK